MSFLYKNASGREVKTSSYSAGSAYRRCPRWFKINRIDGYKEKKRSAAYEMGKVIESAIQFYHENGLKPGECVDETKRLWLKFKDTELVYTDQEQDFENAYHILADQARLYEVLLPTLPIKNPRFQLEYTKELWPGSELAGLGDRAYVDMLSVLDDTTRIIIDIKDQRNPLSLTENLISLDPQLRRYAWLSGIKDVAFLWFVKAKASFKKGDVVTCLEDLNQFKAGSAATVYKAETLEENGQVMLFLTTEDVVQKMDEELGQISGRGSTEKKKEVFDRYLSSGRFVVAPKEAVTKCRLQFVRGRIPEEVLPEIGEFIGHEVVSIQDSYNRNFWPQIPELRGLGSKCGTCPGLGICLGNDTLIEERLVQIKPKQAEEDDWLKELEGDGE